MNNNQPVTNLNYTKIGGWLILVAIGLVLSTISVLLYIRSSILPVFRAVPVSQLSGELQFYLFLDLVLNLSLLIYITYVIVLFFKRREAVPKLMISLYILNFVFIIIDRFVIKSISESQWTFVIIHSVVSSLIWIPYFLISKRVKGTFVVQKEEE